MALPLSAKTTSRLRNSDRSRHRVTPKATSCSLPLK
jgi:hypothetical protein